jgi:UTP--glucose-1-phosphate uridylyltransferase
MHIRKAVLPVAGLGTRVLPASKVVPKELLPIVDRPTLQYIVEEAVAAGIEEVIFVTSRSKRAIEDHFDAFPELEQTLEHKGKQKELEELRRIQGLAKYVVVRQVEPLGLGHAVLCAKELVGDEPFVVMLGDEIYPQEPCLQPMIEAYGQCHSSILTLFTVPREQISSYGIASVKRQEGKKTEGAMNWAPTTRAINCQTGAIPRIDQDSEQIQEGNILQVTDLVEKPKPADAPSDLAVAGRYVITPDIFALIEKLPPGRGGEIQLTDALQIQARQERCHGIHFTGQRYDMGTPIGLLTTSIAMGLQRPDIAPALREYMREALKTE